ncbi:Serine/threonine-protein kinase, partial [Ascosphaera atra]
HNRKQISELEAQARQNGRARALQQQEKERERRAREEQVAMDIALERDYIIVEKRSVEVNCLADAFAEEMAVATSDPAARTRQGQQRGGGQQMIQQAQQEPRPQQRGQEGAGVMTQRHRKQSIKDEEQQQAARSPSNTAGMNQDSGAVSPAANHKALAIRPSSNPDNNDTLRRKMSLERKFGYSPNSATNALTRVLNMATGRLFGGAVPSLPGTGGRSPMGFNPFPPYPISNKNLLLECEGLGTGLGSGTGKAVDEDTRILNIIEECATRSDVVYGFAEVKFKQLLPFPPSMTQTQTENVAIRPLKEELANGGDPENQQHSGNGVEDDGLAVDAVIGLSEEALVLYVKALSLLAKSMDIAGAWWVRKQMPLSPGPSGSDSPTSDVVPYTLPAPSSPTSNGNSNAQPNSSNIIVVGNQVNNVVQWVRRRFNEVLEKAEYCRKRLVSAQEQLPPDQRPVIDGRDGANANGHAPTVGPGSSSSSSSALAEKIVLSSGITAEALMYERAVEMSQQAALNELTGDDLQSCEISYVTAIRMLEAVLEERRY